MGASFLLHDGRAPTGCSKNLRLALLAHADATPGVRLRPLRPPLALDGVPDFVFVVGTLVVLVAITLAVWWQFVHRARNGRRANALF